MRTLVYSVCVIVCLLIGCGGSDVPSVDAGADAETPSDCPAVGCPWYACDRNDGGFVADGEKCLGYSGARKFGWVGFCLSGVCNEYVPVRCQVPGLEVVVGCDGSGTVTNGLQVYFRHGETVGQCVGYQGEYGYCGPGDACAVYDGDKKLGQGTCE
jgi:hypothetical protein